MVCWRRTVLLYRLEISGDPWIVAKTPQQHLYLHSDYHDQFHVVSADLLLREADWPFLRSFQLEGNLSCHGRELQNFLIRHHNITILTLPPMFIGRRWADAKILAPLTNFPDLKSLTCSSSQAVSILANSTPQLKNLTGIELLEVVKQEDFFLWDDEYFSEIDEEEIEDIITFGEFSIASPWRAPLLDAIKSNPSIVSIEMIQPPDEDSLTLLAEVAPQIEILRITPTRRLNSFKRVIVFLFQKLYQSDVHFASRHFESNYTFSRNCNGSSRLNYSKGEKRGDTINNFITSKITHRLLESSQSRVLR
jgi:hypothetical protein